MPNTIAVPAPLPGWPHEAPPFHPGEVAAQARAGVRERMAAGGRRAIRGIMPDQHRDFFAMLPFIVVGSLDRQGRPWASILSGRPGFLQSPDPRTLTVAARPAYGDPLGDNLAAGAPIGLLGIQLETRRRNRMNGTVTEWADGRFAVTVGQSFGNCPQYIQARRPSFVAEPDSLGEARPVHAEGPVLSPRGGGAGRGGRHLLHRHALGRRRRGRRALGRRRRLASRRPARLRPGGGGGRAHGADRAGFRRQLLLQHLRQSSRSTRAPAWSSSISTPAACCC